jgi:hypothetical protein
VQLELPLWPLGVVNGFLVVIGGILVITGGILLAYGQKKEGQQNSEKTETKLGQALQKLEEIKNSISQGQTAIVVSENEKSILEIEDEIKNIAEEFFRNQPEKEFKIRKSQLEIRERELRLNKEWVRIYLFLFDLMKKLLMSYNERLSEQNKIYFEIPEMPSDLFSEEASLFKAIIRFSNGLECKSYLSILKPIERDRVPAIYFVIDKRTKDASEGAEYFLLIHTEEKFMDVHKNRGQLPIILAQEKYSIDENNYKNSIMDFINNLFEQLIVGF